jgi:lipoate-protein ligase A
VAQIKGETGKGVILIKKVVRKRLFMFCITLESTDPYFNLAIEEYLLKNKKEDYLILGINSPSVIIGKHQTPHREINTRYITEHKIPVVRRITGGGTVYHDQGNLNFTFIKQSEPGKQVDFRKYTKPVTDFLASEGVEATFEGKNDLKVQGLKISGNAEHVHRNRVLHHGTLLFSSSLDILRNTLRKDTSHYYSRAVESNPSSVTNLNDRLPQFKDIFEFRSGMMDYFLKNLSEVREYELTEEEIIEAENLAGTKYKTWEWNWAYGPDYNYNNEFEFSGEKIKCRLYVREGTIQDIALEGSSELAKVAVKLIGRRHMVEDLIEVFKQENIKLSEEKLYNFF